MENHQQERHLNPLDSTATRQQQLQLMQKIHIYAEKLLVSQFFDDFLDQIRTPEASHHFHKLTRSSHKVKMVIYGIGSIEKADNPCWQLSLAILIKLNLDCIGDMEVYDPVISLTESKVMEELGFRVLTVNEQCMRQAVDPILFFMPYCDLKLYNNLLNANWRHDMLNRIIILGNSLEGYRQHPLLGRYLLGDGRHLLAVRPFTTEFEIPVIDSNDLFKAFNLSWHLFNVDPDTNLQSEVDRYVSLCRMARFSWLESYVDLAKLCGEDGVIDMEIDL